MNNKNSLIEETFPVQTIGIEVERERNGLFPPLNRLHTWWARRPLIASRAAVLSSIISSDQMSEEEFIHNLGITGETLEKYKTVDSRPSGTLVYEHYGYRRPFTQDTSKEQINKFHEAAKRTWDGELPTVLDMTAGGGAIPYESRRFRFPTIANELNPVASVLLHAVLELPTTGHDLTEDIMEWGEKMNDITGEKLKEYYPDDRAASRPINFLWAHSVDCPDCGIEVPLSPNWWLDKKSANKGIAARPYVEDEKVQFNVVHITSGNDKIENNENYVAKSDYDPSKGTVSYGKGECPRCDVTIDGNTIKSQGQSRGLGFQLYAVEYKDKRSGERGEFKSPSPEDRKTVTKAYNKVESDIELATLHDVERYIGPADRAENYGITKWRDAFHPRQLLSHYTVWEAFEEIKPEIKEEYESADAKAILTYLCLAADKTIDYNSRFSSWNSGRPAVRNTFDRHDFSFKWSFAETDVTDEDMGYIYFLNKVTEIYEEMRQNLKQVQESDPVEILNKDAANLPMEDAEVEAIVMDPPYYDNVMYSELSDFFYIWMKKYLGDEYPELFTQDLTDKNKEAIANTAEYDGIAGDGESKTQLAKEDYEQKMSGILSEAARVLRDDGILTLMFTHKKTEAWDTLTTALIEAGFRITASHPVNTERADSLHQSGKNAAQSTIFLTARKRDNTNTGETLWSKVRNETRNAAFEKARELDTEGIELTKVDMILSAFGPTLEVYTNYYPVVNDEGDRVTPQTALDEARTAVREYLVDQYLNEGIRNVDSKTEWYVLSWLVFEVQRFPYDEGRRLALGVGEDLDTLKKTHRMWRKRSGDVVLRPHSDRVQDVNKPPENRSDRKPVDPDGLSFTTALDKVHAAMHIYDAKGATEAWNWMNDRNCGSDPAFKATLESLLRVLPHNHEDWNIARNIAAGETGELLDLDLDADIFQEDTDDEDRQGSLKDF